MIFLCVLFENDWKDRNVYYIFSFDINNIQKILRHNYYFDSLISQLFFFFLLIFLIVYLVVYLKPFLSFFLLFYCSILHITKN